MVGCDSGFFYANHSCYLYNSIVFEHMMRRLHLQLHTPYSPPPNSHGFISSGETNSPTSSSKPITIDRIPCELFLVSTYNRDSSETAEAPCLHPTNIRLTLSHIRR